MKDILKIVLAILITLAVLAGIAYLFFQKTGEYAKDYAKAKVVEDVAAKGLEGVKGLMQKGTGN